MDNRAEEKMWQWPNGNTRVWLARKQKAKTSSKALLGYTLINSIISRTLLNVIFKAQRSRSAAIATKTLSTNFAC